MLQAGVGTASVHEVLQKRGVDFVFAFPSTGSTVTSVAAGGKGGKDDLDALYKIRRAAVDYSIPLCNNVQVANMLVDAMANVQELTIQGSSEFIHSIKP